jgi:hypothetical protein
MNNGPPRAIAVNEVEIGLVREELCHFQSSVDTKFGHSLVEACGSVAFIPDPTFYPAETRSGDEHLRAPIV